jgi:hypothetical protein
MADQHGEAPKIVIDSDWKAQAQKEREKLAEKERQSKEAAEKAKQAHAVAPGMAAMSGMSSAPGSAPQGGMGSGGEQMQSMPPADFQTLVGTMVTQALMYMGAFPDPETGRAVVSLEHARFHIDLLAVLEEKTRNNLTPEEAGDMKQALGELRNRFVEIVQAIAQMKKEGKLKSGGPGGPGMAGPGMGGLGGTIPMA